MKVQLNIPKLVCSGCVKTVTEAIKTVDTHATIEVNLKTKVVNIETQSSEAAIKGAITAVGYPAT